MLFQNVSGLKIMTDKKVLLHEPKRHTTRRAESARGVPTLDWGYLPWGTPPCPNLAEGIYLGWGVSTLGYPPCPNLARGTYLGAPPILTWLEGTYLG